MMDLRAPKTGPAQAVSALSRLQILRSVVAVCRALNTARVTVQFVVESHVERRGGCVVNAIVRSGMLRVGDCGAFEVPPRQCSWHSFRLSVLPPFGAVSTSITTPSSAVRCALLGLAALRLALWLLIVVPLVSGSAVVSGTEWAKVRALHDDKGQSIEVHSRRSCFRLHASLSLLWLCGCG